MSSVIETVRKIYEKENTVKHIILFIIIAIFTTLSSFYDIKTELPDTWKQNPFDWALNMLIAIYSIQFLHNCFNTPEKAELPQLKDIKPQSILGLICLNLVWSMYFLIAAIIILVWYAATNDLILPAFMCLIAVILLPFIYYCFIEYAKDYSLKGVLRPDVIVKYMSGAFKPTIKIYLQYILAFFVIMIIYFAVYFIGSLAGITELVPFAKDYYLFDFIASAFFEYFLNILLFFMFPYSLLQIFLSHINLKIEKETV